jgi:hypothetical protein
MKKDVAEWKLHRLAKVNDFMEMWQGSQNLPATQQEARTQIKQMTALGYISDTEEIVKASWFLSQYDNAAAFKLARGSLLPPPLSAKDLPAERIQILNVHRIQRINRHPVKCEEDCARESISGTEDWLNLNGDLDNPNDSEDDCALDGECLMEHDNSIQDPESPEQRDVSTTPNVPRLMRPTKKSKGHTAKV